MSPGNLIIVSHLNQCLVNGYDGYMLILSSKTDIGLDLSIVLVVNEYLDVFPNEVTSLPSERGRFFHRPNTEHITYISNSL